MIGLVIVAGIAFAVPCLFLSWLARIAVNMMDDWFGLGD